MDRITVYFVDNHKVSFDRDKATFRAEDGSVFTLAPDDREDAYIHELASDGKALINWSNVCYVKEYTEPREDDDF